VKTIGIDILLSEYEPIPGAGADKLGAGDMALVNALRRQGRAVLAMAMLFNENSPIHGPAEDASKIAFRFVRKPPVGALMPLTADGMLRPLPQLESVAAVGHVNQLPDDAGIARAQYPAIALEEWFVPSFPLMVAAAQRGLSGDEMALWLDGKLFMGQQLIPLDVKLALTLNYLGPALQNLFTA
jgi:hypothetical protein